MAVSAAIRKRKFVKILFLLLLSIAFFKCLFIVAISYYNTDSVVRTTFYNTKVPNNPKMKYILLWTNPTTSPFENFGNGNAIFVKKNCKWTNCYVSSDIYLLGDITEFEVIAFNGPQLGEMLAYNNIPKKRYLSQKYVYANIEAATNYPICTDTWNEFFNWTWTYKLNSDATWGYIVVRNASNHVIGPRRNMEWLSLNEMDDIDDNLKRQLGTKTMAAAWFVSSCSTSSFREEYVDMLKRAAKKFDLTISIFGKCGESFCPVEQMSRCLKMLERDYFFYLAFENALSEDYVTEKILHAINHNTVPIVFGGANYSRFLPDGSYINAFNKHPEKLASEMNEIIRHPAKYYNFFKWKKYYSFHRKHESPDTDDYCNFCALINNEERMKTTSYYNDLDVWWMGPQIEKCRRNNMNVVEKLY